MRSRDGNRSLLLSISSLVLFSSIIYADTYRIGYRAIVKNAILVDETLNISKAMTPCYGSTQEELELGTLDNRNLYKIIKNSSDKFYNYLLHQSLHVSYNNKTTNNISTTLTTLTFPTQCFKVTFESKLVKISLIK